MCVCVGSYGRGSPSIFGVIVKERENERERETYINTYIYIYLSIYVCVGNYGRGSVFFGVIERQTPGLVQEFGNRLFISRSMYQAICLWSPLVQEFGKLISMYVCIHVCIHPSIHR